MNTCIFQNSYLINQTGKMKENNATPIKSNNFYLLLRIQIQYYALLAITISPTQSCTFSFFVGTLTSENKLIYYL